MDDLLPSTSSSLWLPLAQQLAEYRQRLERPLIQGILGGQGTGKSTLASSLRLILSELGYNALCLSLDDLYKTYSDRLELRKQDPRLVWRGPPGTHDIELGLNVLDRLRQPNRSPQPPLQRGASPQPPLQRGASPQSPLQRGASPQPPLERGAQAAIEVPRFDKSAWGGNGDRTQPEVVEGVDIVLFEGWFVGVRPIDPAAFDSAPPPIVTEGDRKFARDMNNKLQDYLPLWERLDRLILLYPVDYRFSVQWRQQAERQMRAAGKSGMSDEEIEQFVNYFWKALHPELFIKPLTRNAEVVDMVIEINRDRSVNAVYKVSTGA